MKQKPSDQHGYNFGSTDEETSLEGPSDTLRTDNSDQFKWLRLLRRIYRHNSFILGFVLVIICAFTIHYIVSLSKALNVQNDNINAYLNTLTGTLASHSAQLDSVMRAQQISQVDSKKLIARQDVISMSLQATMKSLAPAGQTQSQPQDVNKSSGTDGCPYMDFYTVGMKYGTDKVDGHLYHHMYSKYFEKTRCDKIKLVEIGLGCDMAYGPGASFYLWLEFFPNAEIYFIEYDEACAKAWENADPRVKIYHGDQSNVAFLEDFIARTGGDFDYIVDDGGHTWKQQLVSLETLLPSIKVGGVYFLEDLLTSYIPGYDDNPITTVEYIKDIIEDLMTRNPNLRKNKRPISQYVFGMDCMDEVCAFTRQEKWNK
ncbi:MAG: class I SAM-dependent methyltransferase [Sphingobacteriaceae bacterium]|nr:MAG: class I SAM-dependent methyltransferase [Sphingobacteriaceae bacterium]